MLPRPGVVVGRVGGDERKQQKDIQWSKFGKSAYKLHVHTKADILNPCDKERLVFIKSGNFFF